MEFVSRVNNHQICQKWNIPLFVISNFFVFINHNGLEMQIVQEFLLLSFGKWFPLALMLYLKDNTKKINIITKYIKRELQILQELELNSLPYKSYQSPSL